MIVFTKFMRDRFTLAAFEQIARLGRDPFALLIAGIAGLGTAHILVRTAPYGAAIFPDSTRLLSTALNFLAGEGWRDFTGELLTIIPPLFPLLLAAGGWVGIDPLAAGRWVNAIAFGLTILAAGNWLRSNLRSQWLALAATATMATSLPLSHWASSYMTEPLFVLFALLALIQLAAFLHRRTAAPLWWAAVFTALAALTRYPGVALIGTGVLLLWPLARWKETLVFGAASSLPMLAVLARNWAVSGNLTRATGNRTETAGQSLSDGLRQTVDVFRGWIVPPNTPDGLAYLLGLAVGLVGLAGATVILRGHQPAPEDAPAYSRLGPAIPFGVFALIYLAFMVAVVPFTVRNGIGSRYLLPVYIPLLLTVVFLLDRFLSIRMAAIHYGIASLVLLGTLVHIGCSARENLRLTARAYVAGYTDRTYNTARWQHSETLAYLRDNPIEGRIYSNSFIAWFWDRTAAPGKYQLVGEKRIVAEEPPFSRLAQDLRRWTEDGTDAHIVWFRDFSKPALRGYDLMDVGCLPGVEPVAELADGVVFRATAAEPFDPDQHRARRQRYIDQLIQQAGERVVRAHWDVYRNGRKLTYRKQPCAPADTQAKFVLHVLPADPAVLPAYRQRYGYDNLGFYFDRYNVRRGVQRGDQCIAIVLLPNYPIDRIRVGQWIAVENRTLWEAELSGGG